MKRLMLAGVLLLSACTRLAPTAPSSNRLLGSQLETVRMQADVEWPQPPTCKWRNNEVFNYIVAGGFSPNIIQLSDGHRVYIEWAFVEPGTTWAMFSVEDYPDRWCTYPWGWR